MPELKPDNSLATPAPTQEYQEDVPREAGRARMALQAVAGHSRQPLVLLGLFVAAFGVFGYQYYQATQEQASLASQIEVTKAAAGAPLSADRDSEAEAEKFAMALDIINSLTIPKMLDSEIASKALDAAVTSNVEVFMEGTLPSTIAELSGAQYIATPVHLRADGTLPDLQMFLQKLENDTFETIEIQDTVINRNGTAYSMTIQAIVYSEPPGGAPAISQEADGLTSKVGDQVPGGGIGSAR